MLLYTDRLSSGVQKAVERAPKKSLIIQILAPFLIDFGGRGDYNSDTMDKVTACNHYRVNTLPLRRAMLEEGISQRKLAQDMEIHEGTLSRALSERCTPQAHGRRCSRRTYLALCERLRVPVAEVIEEGACDGAAKA